MIPGLVSLLLLPLLVIGCDKATPTTAIPPTTVPDINGGPSQIIDMTGKGFSTDNHIIKNITLDKTGSLTVRLDSNPSTGFEWGDAEISDTSVIILAYRDFVSSQPTPMPGSGGTDVRIFNAKAAGTAIIKLSYGRSWTGGEKDFYTLTINVTVK